MGVLSPEAGLDAELAERLCNAHIQCGNMLLISEIIAVVRHRGLCLEHLVVSEGTGPFSAGFQHCILPAHGLPVSLGRIDAHGGIVVNHLVSLHIFLACDVVPAQNCIVRLGTGTVPVQIGSDLG